MNKILRIVALLAFAIVSQGVSAQVLTRYGDNVGTLDGVMKAYYDVVSTPKGVKPIYQRDNCLHIPDARCGSVVTRKDGTKHLAYMSLKEYHDRSDAGLAKEGFSEREI